MTDKMVIYHGDCLDGFCSAWQAWRALGDEAEYVPAYYGECLPDVAGKTVYVLDFSYKREAMQHLLTSCKKCVVLDHHKTAEEDLKDLAGPTSEHLVVFDMNRSGAGMARDYFHPGEESWLVDYTQDRDLWRFALPGSKLVNAYIGTLPQTFEAYERASHLTAADAERLGVGADAYKSMYVDKMVKHARSAWFDGRPGVPVVNAPYIGISEVVGALAEDAEFAVGWFLRGDGKIAVSLRSRGDFDVSELARRYGGGGHKNAAGFTVQADVWETVVRTMEPRP